MGLTKKTLEYIVPRITWFVILIVGGYFLLRTFFPAVLTLWGLS